MPELSCLGGTFEVDCTNDHIIDSHFSIDKESCDDTPSCAELIDGCTAAGYDVSCDASAYKTELNIAAAYPPKNSFGRRQMCAFYDGESSRFGTQFTNVGYTGRSCWGGLCTYLPNGGSACYCIIKNGEYFEGKLDLRYYNNPQLTVTYNILYIFDILYINIECGLGTQCRFYMMHDIYSLIIVLLLIQVLIILLK